MRVQHRDAKQIQVALSGPIGETSPLFVLPLGDTKELIVDMLAVTYINSIGVKHWVNWTKKVPKACEVKLINCPFVIASQASMVVGFMGPNMKINSVRAPYMCASCSAEESRLIARGTDYDYAQEGKPARIAFPMDLSCSKCSSGRLEPDFLTEKTFKFLG